MMWMKFLKIQIKHGILKLHFFRQNNSAFSINGQALNINFKNQKSKI